MQRGSMTVSLSSYMYVMCTRLIIVLLQFYQNIMKTVANANNDASCNAVQLT